MGRENGSPVLGRRLKKGQEKTIPSHAGFDWENVVLRWWWQLTGPSGKQVTQVSLRPEGQAPLWGRQRQEDPGARGPASLPN